MARKNSEKVAGKFSKLVEQLRENRVTQEKKKFRLRMDAFRREYGGVPYVVPTDQRKKRAIIPSSNRWLGKMEETSGVSMQSKKSIFVAVISTPSVEEGKVICKSYKFPVRGIPIKMWRTKKVRARSADTVKIVYHFFAFKDPSNKWYIHEVVTGAKVVEGYDLHDARSNLSSFYNDVGSANKKDSNSLTFDEILLSKPNIESASELSTKDGLKLLIYNPTINMYNKNLRRKERKIDNDHHRRSFDGVTDLDDIESRSTEI